MNFLIDIGNTRIKYTTDNALAMATDHSTNNNTDNDTDTVASFVLHDNLEPMLTTIKKLVANGQITSVLLTHGRSATALQTKETILQYTKDYQITTQSVSVSNDMLAINYKDISQFGADRFLNLLAAQKAYHNNFCVVSCGTAITLDFYTNQHIGGMIVPGLGLSQQLLSKQAGLDVIKQPPSRLGNDTASSIGAGLYFGFQNLIDRSIETIENELNISLHRVFTGGDAKVLCQKGALDFDLLFKGMCIYLSKELNKEF